MIQVLGKPYAGRNENTMRTLLRTLAVIATLGSTLFAGTIEGKVSSGESVVYVDVVPGKTFPAPSQKAIVNQKNLLFHPSLLVVQQGTTVQFQNDDSVQHNVFWPSVGGNRKLAHNLGTWPQGEKREYRFDQAGVVPLLCNVHPEMSGYIIVIPPLFPSLDPLLEDFEMFRVCHCRTTRLLSG